MRICLCCHGNRVSMPWRQGIPDVTTIPYDIFTNYELKVGDKSLI